MPKGPVGSQWEESSLLPPAGQVAFSWDKHAKLIADQTQLRAVFAAMVTKAGDLEWLARALNRKPEYESKISEAISGHGDRKVQLEWFAPMLDDPRATDILLGWLSERCGYEPPVRTRPVDQAAVDTAAREVIAELKDEEQREVFRQRVAKKLGVRPDRVRL